MTTLQQPRTLDQLREALPEDEYRFSSIYAQSATADEYASRVDDDTLFSDFMAAARAYALDPSRISHCAHVKPSIVMPIKGSDPKIDLAISRYPAVLARVIQSEKLTRVFAAREALHNVLSH